MSDVPPTDPFALSRELVSQWERSVNDLLTQHMSSSEFGKQMNAALASSEQTMKAIGSATAPLMVATKEDIAKLGKRLEAVEGQLARVTALLERLTPEAEGDAAPSRSIARTKRFSAADSKKS